MKKRIVPILLCLVLMVAAIVLLPENAQAATAQETGNAILANVLKQDGTFPETLPEGQTTHRAYCYVCGDEKDWKPMTGILNRADITDGDHYYMPKDISVTSSTQTVFNSEKVTVCIHTNGKTFTNVRRFFQLTGGSTLNIMGGGKMKSTGSNDRGTFYSNGVCTLNVYGTTIENTSKVDGADGCAALAQYNTSGVFNLWGCNLVTGGSSAILANGTINLYNCTVTGGTAKIGNYSGQTSTKAGLTVVDSTIPSLTINTGTLAASGVSQIGNLNLASGKTIDPTGLSFGSAIMVSSNGVVTAAGNAAYAQYFSAVNSTDFIDVRADGAICCWPEGAQLVDASGNQIASDDLLTDWAAGSYSYIKLFGDENLEMLGEDIVVDLNGYDLTVTGTGTVTPFDSANDSYDGNACGTVLNNGTVTVKTQVVAPNGNTYVAITDGNRATMHRLEMKLVSVSVRTNAAGIYYKASYTCDDTLAAKVKSYGVVLSVNNMPGADFKDAAEVNDRNAYTIAAAPFKSGVTATSGSVFGIMKDGRTASENDTYAKMPIYANAYIDVGNGPVVTSTATAGLTVSDSGFGGVALSLYDVMTRVDAAYKNYGNTEQMLLDQFYAQWKEKGMNWSFTNIGKTAGTTDKVDNTDIELKFDEGTTDAVCPVCKTKVTWTALTDNSNGQNLQGHYYLTGDITYTGTATAYLQNGKTGGILCVHLNGHDITATKTRVIHGSNGRVNIMGNGIVTGYQSSADLGAAAMINNGAATNGIHLYGGTYRKTANSVSGAAVVCVNTVGGTLNIYEGAIIDNPSGTAVIAKSPTNTENATKSELGLYGCTINGNVELKGAKGCKIETYADLLSCTVNGKVNVATLNNVTLGGALKITNLTLAEGELVETRTLTEGTSIGIANRGIFTKNSASVNGYLNYFHGVDAVNKIKVRDNALYCGPDYTGDLEFQEGTNKAMCPVCAEVVTWIPVDGTEKIVNTGTNHYYLTQNVEFTNSSTAGGNAFISPGHGSHTVCFHLNGHDMNLTNTRLIYGGTSTTNIMGSGTVTGARSDNVKCGSTIQINVSSATGTVNVYSGIYTQSETCQYAAEDFVVSVTDNGGTINIYEDAIIRPNSNGKAIYVGTGNLCNSKLGIYGAAVEGSVYVAGSQNPDSAITVDGGEIQGEVTVKGATKFTVGSDAKIQLLNLPETVQLTLDALTDGASIKVKNVGTFTLPNTNAETYAKYFSSVRTSDMIVVRDNALRCKPNYEAKLYPDADGVAFCQVCQKNVKWTAISTNDRVVPTTDGSHYYLTKDIIYEPAYNGDTNPGFFTGMQAVNTTICLNLNGYDINSTNSHGIFCGWGVLNVFGSGTVTGKAPGVTASGGAVQVNNSASGSGVHLYSGTYRNSTASPAGSYVVALSNVGGGLYIYEDADISNPGNNAIYLGTSIYRDGNLEIYGATVKGNIVTAAPDKSKGDFKGKLVMKDTALAGTLNVASGIEVTLDGKTQITRMNVAADQKVTFTNMKAGSSVTVDADGIFSGVMPLADEWLQYIKCANVNEHIIVRDKQFYQGVPVNMNTAAVASENDKTALNTTYKDAVIRYGEMHNHTNSGPYSDDGTGYWPSTGADGKNSLEEWIAEMDRLKMDFAFIVDHGMSIHMYKDKFLPDYFIGGTEPATTITDSKAGTGHNKPHYNMLFAYPEQLESIFFKWEAKFKPIKWNAENYPTAQNPSEEGYRVLYPTFTTAEFGQLAKDVYDAGGLLVHVHPKYDSYIYSDDPMDYYFADYTGFEIITGDGKKNSMMYKDNAEAYETWVDILEAGKKVWATAGSDSHKLPNYESLTAMYTVNDHKDDYMAAVRAGNMAPGWVGIRMNVNGTAMGGETSFAGQRLQFSVGEIYAAEQADSLGTPSPYVEGHTYRVELYDDGGILMTAQIDPREVNYFAIDCDETAMFYRVVVWDETDNERIGVSNPIWNKTEE